MRTFPIKLFKGATIKAFVVDALSVLVGLCAHHHTQMSPKLFILCYFLGLFNVIYSKVFKVFFDNL